jgi:DNA modification methylase
MEGEDIQYPVRNKRSVWTVNTKPYKEAHFATYPEALILPCILAGCPVGGTVLDPFNGAGTTGLVSQKNNRNYIGIDINPEYIKLTEKRLSAVQPTLPV